jgi:hypothetical protein
MPLRKQMPKKKGVSKDDEHEEANTEKYFIALLM